MARHRTPWITTLAITILAAQPAAAFAPVTLTPADPPTDSPWGNNDIGDIRVGWDTDTLTYEVDYTIEENALITLISAGITGGEDNYATFNGWAGAFPTNTTTSLPMDHMSAFYGCDGLYAYALYDGGSNDVTAYPGVTALRSNYNCDGSAGTAHVDIDWNELCFTGPGQVPPGLTLYLASFIRAGDDTDPADLAPDSATVWFIDNYFEIQVDADWDGLADAAWAQPGNNVATPDPADNDGDGLPAHDGDCDDTDANINPNAAEDCADGQDNDCDGDVDGADADCPGDDDDDDDTGDDDTGDDDTGDDDTADDDTADDDTADDDTADDDTADDDTADDDDDDNDDDDNDDDTTTDDDDTTIDDATVGCTCGNPGLPPEFGFAGIFAIGCFSLGRRRRP